MSRKGPDYGSYYNELFLRGRPDLCHRMVRVKSLAASERILKEEPDFYAMEPVGVNSAATNIAHHGDLQCGQLKPAAKLQPSASILASSSGRFVQQPQVFQNNGSLEEILSDMFPPQQQRRATVNPIYAGKSSSVPNPMRAMNDSLSNLPSPVFEGPPPVGAPAPLASGVAASPFFSPPMAAATIVGGGGMAANFAMDHVTLPHHSRVSSHEPVNSQQQQQQHHHHQQQQPLPPPASSLSGHLRVASDVATAHPTHQVSSGAVPGGRRQSEEGSDNVGVVEGQPWPPRRGVKRELSPESFPVPSSGQHSLEGSRSTTPHNIHDSLHLHHNMAYFLGDVNLESSDDEH